MINNNLKHLITLLFMLVTLWVNAHPQHASYAELNFNSDKTKLQIAIQLIPEDFEAALSKANQQDFVLVESKAVDTLIMKYLWNNFKLINIKTQKQLPINWVGKEVSHKGAWVYFTADMGSASHINLANTLLLNYQARYINHVKLITDSKQNFVFSLSNTKQQIMY